VTPASPSTDFMEWPAERARHAVKRILTAAAATLRIVHIHCEVRDHFYFPVALPRLEELTLERYFTHRGFVRPACFGALPETPPVWPSLRRLKLTPMWFRTTDNDGAAVDAIVPAVAQAAPNLSHLYLECSAHNPASLAHNVNAWLQPQSAHHIPSLRRVFMGPAEADEQYHSADSMTPDKQGVADFALADARLVLLPGCRKVPYERRLKEWRAEREWDWLERIAGRPGTWDDSRRFTCAEDFTSARRGARPRRNESTFCWRSSRLCYIICMCK